MKPITADMIAIPFWIILIIYSLNEIKMGNIRAYLVLIIIAFALFVDSSLVYKYLKKEA